MIRLFLSLLSLQIRFSEQYFFTVETLTISLMNTKSGTNGILPRRTKHGIRVHVTLDLQKQMILFKKQQKACIVILL